MVHILMICIIYWLNFNFSFWLKDIFLSWSYYCKMQFEKMICMKLHHCWFVQLLKTWNNMSKSISNAWYKNIHFTCRNKLSCYTIETFHVIKKYIKIKKKTYSFKIRQRHEYRIAESSTKDNINHCVK